ncbi:hypothetical protein [Bradyrhizobium sp. ORS 285]|uniref:hypothetical protein n=1 Tax=Bradyrhizobium sp. ORS 285 TaxID=115808 RepID=UPI000558E6E4|nr:hypothetical protein [Bradyrhizobium sp. ORS 285]
MRALLIVLCLVPGIAFAKPVKTELFGHTIEIKEVPPDDDDQLFVDGKLLLTKHIIDLDNNGRIGATDFVIGSSSDGGNACDESPFVLRFTANQPVRLDGPLNNCAMVKQTIEPDRIVFETAPRSTLRGHRWTWTANGFGPVEDLKFQTAAKGWDALSRGAIYKTEELLGYAELAKALKAAVSSARYPDLQWTLSGLGKVRYDGKIFIGEACQLHNCSTTAALVVMDAAKKRVAVAMRYNDKPLLIVPADAKWPAEAQKDLEKWRRDNVR